MREYHICFAPNHFVVFVYILPWLPGNASLVASCCAVVKDRARAVFHLFTKSSAISDHRPPEPFCHTQHKRHAPSNLIISPASSFTVPFPDGFSPARRRAGHCWPAIGGFALNNLRTALSESWRPEPPLLSMTPHQLAKFSVRAEYRIIRPHCP